MTLARGDVLGKIAKTYNNETKRLELAEPHRLTDNEAYVKWSIDELSPTWSAYNETTNEQEIFQFVLLKKVY